MKHFLRILLIGFVAFALMYFALDVTNGHDATERQFFTVEPPRGTPTQVIGPPPYFTPTPAWE